ncbi:unnamed protein product [Durusdinium trenchii]|uniref:Uncharacterized protein n=1 Tax=Durusdinium trenchii TaxID=1381693 RepID=A0ABP0ILJ1_9DINO
MSRDPNSKKSHIWTELLRVTPEKQCVFVQRVLFLHDLASRRGARSASSRLNIQEWGIECERMIFLSSMVLHMSVVTDDHGGRIFSDEVVRSIVLRCVEGDYNSEAEDYLTCMDPHFKIEDTSMWKEHAPKPTETVATKVAAADSEVDNLTKESRKAQFDADCIALARDCAQIGQLVKEVNKCDQTARTERVLHLRHQNTIGAGLVSEYMATNMALGSGSVKDQQSLMDRFLSRFPDTPTIIYADLMKCGRCSNQELNEFSELLSAGLAKRPHASVAIVVAPWLCSEKVCNGYRGELRRWEDKFDARGLYSESMAVRATRAECPWQAEASYIVPVASKDAIPHASEGHRQGSLSDVQESAQFLVQDVMVRSLLESVLARAQIPENTNTIALVNLTPYDGMVERATRKWKEISVDSPFHFKTLSLTKNLGICEFEWKSGSPTFGKCRPYEPRPPPTPANQKIDLANFPVRLVKIEYDLAPGKKGWQQYKVSIPPAVRGRYVDDIVYRNEWAELLKDFDKQFGVAAGPEEALVPAPSEPESEPLPPWTEPESLDQLLDAYIVETKMAGRIGGTSLYLMPVKRRDGSVTEIIDGQKWKLFLAPRLIC